MKKFSLILIFTFLYFFVSGQDFSGKVVDTYNTPVQYAKVMLYSADSIFIEGSSTDSLGNFRIGEPTAGGKLLKISSIGHITSWLSYPFPEIIELKDDTLLLKSVDITARKQIFKLEPNGISTTIHGSVFEKLQNADEVISQLPFVTGRDGEYSVFGKGKPLIYINNRPLTNIVELKQLSPQNIKSIKVITTPGAQYDPTVKAVIKIITERPLGDGLSGQLYSYTNKTRKIKGNEYLFLNYRSGGWDTFGSINYGLTKDENYSTTIQDLIFANKNNKQEFNAKSLGNYNGTGFNYGINFSPTLNQSLGIKYSVGKNNNNVDFNSENKLIEIENSATTSSTSNQIVDFIEKNHEHNVNAYYSGAFLEKIFLNVYANYVNGGADNSQNSIYKSVFADTITNDYNRNYSMAAGKAILDYLVNDFTISVGTEYSYTDMKQNYFINNTDLGIENSDDKLLQNRVALFASFQSQFGKMGISGGLRYEKSDLAYYQHNVFNQEQSQLYHNFLPDLSLSYSTGKSQYQLGYSRTISFPSYNNQRSNISYVSPYIYETGNPYLKPEIDNNITGVFVWKDFQAIAQYVKSENAILNTPEIYLDKDIVIYTINNIPKFDQLAVALAFRPHYGIWHPSLQLGISKQNLKIADISYSKPMVSFTYNHIVVFKNNWMSRVDIEGNTAGNMRVSLMKPSFRMNLEVSKTFFNNKLYTSVGVEDVFYTSNINWSIHSPNLTLNKTLRNDTRGVFVKLSYSFNNTQNKFKGRSASDEINRLK